MEVCKSFCLCNSVIFLLKTKYFTYLGTGKGSLKCLGQPFSYVVIKFAKFLEMNITLTVFLDDAVQPRLSLMLC
jgi:hypothetical protein